MAATATCKLIATVEGLGKVLEFAENWATTTTPTRACYNYHVQAVAATAEVLPLGDVTTVHLAVIKCIAGAVDIDTSYVTTFSAEVSIQVGEVAVLKPSGILWLKANGATASTIEYILVGV